ncbi:MAG: hypothetical protein ACI94Y_000148 [Maribacter sp.]|jgi:hypothetical protein
MKYLLSISILFFVIISSYAQIELYGISTAWDDSYKEWVIYTTDEEQEGEIELRWASKDDWSEWDYRLDEESGSIKQKWNNDPSQWELRGGNEIITMRTKWSNDFTEWRISAGGETFTLKSKYRNQLEEWELQGDTYGKFEMYTTYENDPRDWEIIDELDEEVSFHIKMAMLFIVMYHGTPKI